MKKLCLLYIKGKHEWQCAFCNKDVDESDHQFNDMTNKKLLFNGLLSNGVGDKFSIDFRNREGNNFDPYEQYVCSDCSRINENEQTRNDQPYFLEPKIFTYNFIHDHHPDAVIKGFMDEGLMVNNGPLFHQLITGIGQNMVEKRREIDNFIQSFEKMRTEIENNAKFLYTGRELKVLTGLKKEDFDEIVKYVKPFRTYFRSLSVEEVVTALFAYMRTNTTYEQLSVLINHNRRLARLSSISRQMLSEYIRKGKNSY